MKLVLTLAVAALLSGRTATQAVPAQDPAKSTKDDDIEYSSRSSLPGTIQGRLATMLATGYVAGARSLRSFTFISQGTAHRLCRAMKPPMKVADEAARRRNAGDA